MDWYLIFPKKNFSYIREKLNIKKFFYIQKNIRQEQLEQIMLLGDKSIIREEKISRIYTATNAKQETSEGVVQDNQQQLYKFTTEYNPNERLQTEYNLLVKSAEALEESPTPSVK